MYSLGEARGAKCHMNLTSPLKKIIKESQNSKVKFGYKFGLEFLNSKHGRKFVAKLKDKITFGDYKLADIPNTCSSAIKAIKDLKLNYLTIHISSGLKAIEEAKKVSGKTKLIGVTVLTSLDNKSLREIGFNKDIKKLVLRQAKLAAKAKLDAIVCSPHEIKIVKKVFKKEIITPGIRFLNDKKGDQKRVMTPKEPFQNGATALVVGRSITNGNIKFSDNEAQLLRDYLIGGGFLHADDNYGMDQSFRREMKKVFPELDWVEIPKEHEIFNIVFSMPNGLPKIHEHDNQRPQAFGLFYKEELVSIYTYESDLGDGWEDPEVHNNPKDVRLSALQMGTNIIVYGLLR